MELRRALRISPGQAVAFVGAGGKTGAIRRLVAELGQISAATSRNSAGRSARAGAGGPPGSRPSAGRSARAGAGGPPGSRPSAGALAALPVLVSTTTRIGLEQADLAARHLIDPTPDELRQLPQLLQGHASLLVTGAEDAGKWTPPAEAVLRELAERVHELGAALLIEADGARGRSVKAPADHEPVIPEFVDLVVPIAGLLAVGQSVGSVAVHRPERLASLLGLEPTDRIAAEHVASLLASAEGGLKAVPQRAEVRALLTQATADRMELGREVALRLLAEAPAEQVRAVTLADLRAADPVAEVHARVAGVVLAAGGSSRLGQPKQLIEWRGRPLVAHAVAAAVEGGLDPVVVVLGDGGQQVRQALEGKPVEFVQNPDWPSGQSSSVRAGLQAVRARSEAAAFLLSDTPLVDAGLVRTLLDRQRSTLAPLIAPWAAGRRANPVVFDRAVYPQLIALEGDVGGRVLFEQLQVEWVEWDDSIALDLDTPEDLERLRELE